jgi:hypothetical protein
LKGERNSLFPNLIASKSMLGSKNARKQNKYVLWGNIIFLRMKIFSSAENIQVGNTLAAGDLVRFIFL